VVRRPGRTAGGRDDSEEGETRTTTASIRSVSTTDPTRAGDRKQPNDESCGDAIIWHVVRNDGSPGHAQRISTTKT
jgi:hypothetical protein